MTRILAVFGVLTLYMGVAASASATVVDGSTSGVFVNPAPNGAFVQGVGTDDFKFGQPFGGPASELIFAGDSFAGAPLETPFRVGTLTYKNGQVVAGTEATAVDLSLTLNFTNPALGAVPNAFTLDLVSTPNVGTPQDSADYVFFPTSFGSNTFDIGGTLYTVRLTGFSNITGNGFLDSNGSRLHVLEGGVASADLYAEVTSQTAAPEPATWGLLLLGFAGLGLAGYRKGRKPVAI